MKQQWLKYFVLVVGVSISSQTIAVSPQNFVVDQVTPYSAMDGKLSRRVALVEDDSNAKIEAMSQLGDLYVLYNRIDRLNDLILNIESITGYKLSNIQQAKLLYFKGYSEYFSGYSNKADTYLNDSLNLLRDGSLDNAQNTAISYFQTEVKLLFGLNKAYLQDYQQAISIATSTYEFAAKHNWSNLQGRSLYYLGNIQYELKNYESALEYYKRALGLYTESESVDLAVTNMAVAQMINIVGDKLEALTILDKVLLSFEKQQNINGLADVYLLKSYFLRDSQSKEALNWLSESVKIRERLGIPADISNAYVHFGALLFKNGNLEDALKYSRLATEISDSLDDFSSKWDANASYGILLNENEDYQQAYQYMRKAERALLAKARLDITNETARLSVQFKLRQQQLENIYTERQKAVLEDRNLLLQSQVSLQQEMHDTQSWIVVGLLVLVIIFLGLLLIIYRLYARTKILASRDGLTGLSNRRTIIADAEHEYAVSQRYGHGLSIIMLDIDQFKLINDQHGHAEGDKVLKFIATVLTNMLRDSDYLGRIGGEEFLYVLPHTDETEAFQFAERIRKNIRTQLAKANHNVMDVTVSLGVASCSNETESHTSNVHKVIAKADQALYLAKNQGRDQVQVIKGEHVFSKNDDLPIHSH